MRQIFSESTAAFESVVTGCIPQDDIQQQLHDEFISQGMSEEQATCVATSVSSSISAQDLVDASSGSMPASLQQAITQAVQTCSAGG
jgi:hypothetical protein